MSDTNQKPRRIPRLSMTESQRISLIEEKINEPDEEPVSLSHDYVIKFMEELGNFLNGRQINPANIVAIVTHMMITAGSYTNISGPQKKELVIYVVKHYIREADMDDDLKFQLLVMFDVMIPSLIDTLISASKSEFVFRLKKRFAFCCAERKSADMPEA